jgi:hypothetical protein
MTLFAGVPASESLPKARAAADGTLQIDDLLAEAHTSSAMIYQHGIVRLTGEDAIKLTIPAVNVTLAPNFTAGKPLVLFSRSMQEDSSGRAYGFMADYDVSNDGRRFVFPKYNPNAANVPRASVILDWFVELKRLTDAGK